MLLILEPHGAESRAAMADSGAKISPSNNQLFLIICGVTIPSRSHKSQAISLPS